MRVGQVYTQGTAGYRFYIVRQAPIPDEELRAAVEEDREAVSRFWMMTTWEDNFDSMQVVTEPPANAPETTSLLAKDTYCLRIGAVVAQNQEQIEGWRRKYDRGMEQMAAQEQERRDRFNTAINVLLKGMEGDEFAAQIISCLKDYGFRPPARAATIRAHVLGETRLKPEDFRDGVLSEIGRLGGAGITSTGGYVALSWGMDVELIDDYDGNRACPCEDGSRLSDLASNEIISRDMITSAITVRDATCSLCHPDDFGLFAEEEVTEEHDDELCEEGSCAVCDETRTSAVGV